MTPPLLNIIKRVSISDDDALFVSTCAVAGVALTWAIINGYFDWAIYG